MFQWGTFQQQAPGGELEFQDNYERFQFLKWGSQAFKNLSIAPPGTGIIHQVNLEYLARGVFVEGPIVYPLQGPPLDMAWGERQGQNQSPP